MVIRFSFIWNRKFHNMTLDLNSRKPFQHRGQRHSTRCQLFDWRRKADNMILMVRVTLKIHFWHVCYVSITKPRTGRSLTCASSPEIIPFSWGYHYWMHPLRICQMWSQNTSTDVLPYFGCQMKAIPCKISSFGAQFSSGGHGSFQWVFPYKVEKKLPCRGFVEPYKNSGESGHLHETQGFRGAFNLMRSMQTDLVPAEPE